MKKVAVALLAGMSGVLAGGLLRTSFIPKNSSDKTHKFKTYYNMLNQWMILKNQGKKLDLYFVENNIKTIAVYGMGEIGERLLEELKDSHQVEVKYAIDKEADFIYSGVPVQQLSKELEDVDAVVVTAVFAFEEIKQQIKKVKNFEVISLEEVLYGR